MEQGNAKIFGRDDFIQGTMDDLVQFIQIPGMGNGIGYFKQNLNGSGQILLFQMLDPQISTIFRSPEEGMVLYRVILDRRLVISPMQAA